MTWGDAMVLRPSEAEARSVNENLPGGFNIDPVLRSESTTVAKCQAA